MNRGASLHFDSINLSISIMASRFFKFSSYLTLFFAIWLSLLNNLVPITVPPQYRSILFSLPFYLLILFGCYSLAAIGYNLLIFRECPDAMKELESNIQQARNNLRSYGFKDDQAKR
jgi:dolichyl-phosphate mannosyltransferase polypeptide 3